MTDKINNIRRQVLLSSAAFGSLALATPLRLAIAEDELSSWWPGKGLTPGVTAGPFYPIVNKPLKPGSDLTDGPAGRAQGQLIYVMGQVVNMKGTPVRGLEIEIWQANSAGRYNHPSDSNRAPLDPNFNGFGIATTDSEGRYRFKSVVPGEESFGTFVRAPHIHFQLTGRRDRLITQMWFPNEPLNDKDAPYVRLSPSARELVTCKLESSIGNMEPDSKIALFNLMVPNG